ncbi:MAG TPA: amidohydrolase/deacetylase family metallohydrolase [Acidimicrobiales bacterium]|jgi:dihydroorotase|nr:amidohydrolase/deacetylase family metallohydrolase [Acidimicrobiales bacterium]
MTKRYDVVLAGGQVLDPWAGPSREADVGIAGGRVGAIAPGLAGEGRTVLDCTGCLVTAGLIDGHTHIFAKVSMVGAPADEAHLRRGVVAAVDAGTSGASTFAGFKAYVAAGSRMRVLAFLNVSVLGLIDFRFGELVNPDTLVSDDAVAVAGANPDLVRGLKIRLSTDVVGDRCIPLLEAAVEVGRSAGLPLMVHIGETAPELPEILERLRPGDMVAHCFTGKPQGILTGDGKVQDAVWAARSRGVLFECAHGKSNFSYEVARLAIDQGFLPDLVCSDTSYRNWNGPVYDLLTTMSKLVALGMSLDDVIERCTIAPARFLGLWDEGYGRLEVGGPAHVSVFSWLDHLDELADGTGKTLPVRRLEPRWAVLGGQVVDAVPWRGVAASTS